jgi:phosphate transport system substrate-binding protein
MPKNGMFIRISLVVAAAATLATIAVTAAGAARQSASLSGAGSTFVAPLIATWTQIPSQAGSPFTTQKGITVTYGGGGSGAGESAILNRTVDFGASDAPFSAFAANCAATCYQIPTALSAVAIIYRIDGLPAHTHLRLTGQVLGKIYLGQITNWNDKAIKALNKTVTIPSTPITTVHRDASSGTTFLFTDFLSSASAPFKNQVGKSTFPSWPGSNTAQAHGSNGMAAYVSNNNGAIGYVDLYYGIQNHLDFAKLGNKAGKYVLPSVASIKAASKIQTKPDANGELSIVNPPATAAYEAAYPDAGYTYFLAQKQSDQAASLKTFLNWAVTKGQTFATADYFVPLPAAVVAYDTKTIAKITQH